MPEQDITNVEIPLSQRELEILRLVATGATNQQIAAKLDITLNTVKVHVRNIFAKLDVASRTEASLYAVRMGLVTVDAARAEAPADQAPAPPPPPVEEPAAEAASAADGAPRGEAAALPQPVAPPAPRRVRWWVFAGVAAIAVLVLLGVWAALGGGLPTDPAATAAPAPTQAASEWRPRAVMNVPRTDSAIAAYDGKIYVVGGVEPGGVTGVVERYSPSGDTWTSLSPKPTPVADARAVLIGGKIYVAGGRLESGAATDVFEVYDPQQDRWEALPSLPAPRSRYAAAAIDGKLYLFGGWDGAGYSAEVWMFEPDAGEWTPRQEMPAARGGMALSIVQGMVHLIGGRGAEGPQALHQIYDPTRDRAGERPWRVLAPLPQPIERPTSVVVLDNIYVYSPAAAQGWSYEPDGDLWRSFPASSSAESDDLQAVFVGASIYLLGSTSQGGGVGFSHLEREAVYRVPLPAISR
jgi:DNA-binding CsgD family transcriptional regulator